jgi:hypothetical protein
MGNTASLTKKSGTVVITDGLVGFVKNNKGIPVGLLTLKDGVVTRILFDRHTTNYSKATYENVISPDNSLAQKITITQVPDNFTKSVFAIMTTTGKMLSTIWDKPIINNADFMPATPTTFSYSCDDGGYIKTISLGYTTGEYNSGTTFDAFKITSITDTSCESNVLNGMSNEAIIGIVLFIIIAIIIGISIIAIKRRNNSKSKKGGTVSPARAITF